jgi:hypothetical protein
MAFLIMRTESAVNIVEGLAQRYERKLRKVRKILGLLSENSRHPRLYSHKREAEQGPNGEDIWESYVVNKTPSAQRVFWFYGPGQNTITVFAITPHP